MPRTRRDLTGLMFGKLTAVRPVESRNLRWLWEFRCECGALVVREGRKVAKSVKEGHVPACPDCARKAAGDRNRTHGMTGTPLYNVWHSMIQRCTEPTHHAWSRYGGRGISVCSRWRKFENFHADMAPAYRKGLVLDRVDNNGSYCPENCRWTTWRESARNTGQTLELDVCLLAKMSGIGRSTIQYRLDRGWPADKLLLPPSPRNTGLRLAGKASKRKKYSTS